jgi:hypothetical protein
MFLAICRRRPRRGIRSSTGNGVRGRATAGALDGTVVAMGVLGGGAAGAAGTGRGAATAAEAATTSSFVTRPPGPVPATEARSIPRSSASRRTDGAAFTRVRTTGDAAASGGADSGVTGAPAVGVGGSDAPTTDAPSS